MSEARVRDILSDDRLRWSLALVLSVLLHAFVIGIGAVLGQLIAGQPANGGCFAFFFLLLFGPFVATYATARN